VATGLIALLDDVAALAKIAAASLDDAAAQAVKAGSKAAGIVIDDAAVTPRYVVGFAAERELPLIWRIAKGSLRNKMLFLLPAALALTRLVHGERASVDRVPVEGLDGRGRLGGVADLDEREPTRAAGLTVGDHVDADHLAAVGLDEATELVFGGVEVEVADVEPGSHDDSTFSPTRRSATRRRRRCGAC
jgi:hypothetical protein